MFNAKRISMNIFQAEATYKGKDYVQFIHR